MGPVLNRAPADRTTDPSDGERPTVLSARSLSKRFSGRIALQTLDLDLRGGEVRGLLGHNGSGKSTCVKILSGYHRPEPGATLSVCGTAVSFTRTGRDPARRSMSFVHQDLALLPSATVVENFGIGRYLTGRGGVVSWRRERARLAASLEQFSVSLAPERTVAELTATDRAVLAIARAFDQLAERHSGVLVLDEPTTLLPVDGVDRVYAAIRTLTSHGIGVLLVTHNLSEVHAITDRVTVLRDGHRVLEALTAGLSTGQLIDVMTADAPGPSVPRPSALSPPRPTGRGTPVLIVDNLTGGPVHDVSFGVRAGEIVGLTGLLGSGFEHVPYLLFGAAKARGGSVRLGDQMLALDRHSPSRAIRAGLALVPGDRARRAAVLDASAADNMTLGNLAPHSRHGRLRPDLITRHATALMHDGGVRPVEPGRELHTFSGGNQQKAVLAKWLDRDPAVLLLDEPVHGVDVASRAQILARLAGLAATGTAIVLATADHDDLVSVCDLVLVFAFGRVTARLRGDALTGRQILSACHRPAAVTTSAGSADMR